MGGGRGAELFENIYYLVEYRIPRSYVIMILTAAAALMLLYAVTFPCFDWSGIYHAVM